MAPVVETEQRIGYDEARELVLDCYRTFSPELGATVEEFFTGDHIDAPPLPGKRGGAFCSYAVPSAHPYVMLNYTSLPIDVLIMAHELGHGVALRGAAEGDLRVRDPLTVAETASIFGETIVLERLLERADATARLSLLAESLDGAVAAVFRQVAMNRFEDRVHGERRNTGEIPVDGFAAAWLDTQAELLGDSVELTPDYASCGPTSRTSSIRPATSTPTRTDTCWRCRSTAATRRRDSWSYLELLRAGGSRSPEELGAIVGVDLTDPGFWDAGLDLIERQLEQAEETAAEAEAERS